MYRPSAGRGALGECGHASRTRPPRSAASAPSVMSIGSAGSILSIGSAGSILSIGSAGSVLSVGSVASVGSLLSAASVWSMLSALSRWSLLAWRSAEPSPWRSAGRRRDVLRRRDRKRPSRLRAVPS